MAFCCTSRELRVQNRINKDIERQLKLEQKQQGGVIKFLLLGPRGSGKSTLIKQLRLTYGEGYSEAQRSDLVPLIHRTILRAIQALIEAMETLNIPYSSADLRDPAQELHSVNADTVITLSSSHVSLILSLWADPGLQTCYKQRREFQFFTPSLMKKLANSYFLDAVERVSRNSYIPSDQDVLRIKQQTFTAISEYYFSFNTIHIRMTDLQMSAPGIKRWLPDLDIAHCLLYFVPISDYNCSEYDDESNMLKNHLDAFKLQICSGVWSQYSEQRIFLLFTKTDIFVQKIMEYPLVDYFPDYDGPINCVEEAWTFIAQLFKSCLKESTECHYFFMNTLSIHIIWQQIFATLKESILLHHLAPLINR